MRSHTVISSPLGELTLVAEDGALVGCLMALPDREPGDERLGEPAAARIGRPGPGDAAAQLEDYFAGRRTSSRSRWRRGATSSS